MNENIEKLVEIARAEVGTREDLKIIPGHESLNTKGLHGWHRERGRGAPHLRPG